MTVLFIFVSIILVLKGLYLFIFAEIYNASFRITVLFIFGSIILVLK